jgi:hypothetical protein
MCLTLVWGCGIFDLLGKFPKDKGQEVKFVIRRAVLGLVALPVVAGTYVFCFMLLASLTNSFPNTLDEVWANGILIGFVSAVAFAFATQLDRFSARVIGEVK